ncbi:MAG: hypothetical protein EOM45_11345 [Clostridia bacterium]|nr:hypothetical protein [Clostridia bacterium]
MMPCSHLWSWQGYTFSGLKKASEKALQKRRQGSGRIHARRYQFYSADEAFSRAVRESENTGNLSLVPEILIDWGELEIKRYRYDEAKQNNYQQAYEYFIRAQEFADSREKLSSQSSAQARYGGRFRP